MIWRGLAYPFCAEGIIDIESIAFPPGECSPWEQASSMPPQPFALIDGADEAYALLPGSIADCDEAASQLRNAGVTIVRTGRYLGDPLPQLQADWFVRFVKPADKADLQAFIGSVLGHSLGAPPPQDSAELRIRVLRQELASARAREANLRAELYEVKTKSIDAGRLELELAELQAALAEEKQRAESLSVMPSSEPVLDVAIDQAASVPTRPSPAVPGRLTVEIQTVLEVLLPRVRLLRDSLDVVATEFGTRQSVYRALAELHEIGSRPSAWKKVQGADGWWERHVSNGQDNQGRAYARLNAEDRRWEVLISHKSAQPRDMKWLRDQGD
ncbi:MAG TPA: hypothetical protein VFA50_21745 [Stellaceae bacterium]|nr:hypothetical protein [Stellaceae bacterium]